MFVKVEIKKKWHLKDQATSDQMTLPLINYLSHSRCICLLSHVIMLLYRCTYLKIGQIPFWSSILTKTCIKLVQRSKHGSYTFSIWMLKICNFGLLTAKYKKNTFDLKYRQKLLCSFRNDFYLVCIQFCLTQHKLAVYWIVSHINERQIIYM